MITLTPSQEYSLPTGDDNPEGCRQDGQAGDVVFAWDTVASLELHSDCSDSNVNIDCSGCSDYSGSSENSDSSNSRDSSGCNDSSDSRR